MGFAPALEHAVRWLALCGLRGVSAGWGVSRTVGDDFVGGPERRLWKAGQRLLARGGRLFCVESFCLDPK